MCACVCCVCGDNPPTYLPPSLPIYLPTYLPTLSYLSIYLPSQQLTRRVAPETRSPPSSSAWWGALKASTRNWRGGLADTLVGWLGPCMSLSQDWH